ncbi:MAG: tol-pal system protein YbgF [Gammaproteobacteria bacterium]|jgi:tol-pal system protein YbgF
MKTATSPLRLLALGFVLASAGTGVAYAQSTLTPEQLSLRVERLTELSQRSEAKLGDLQEQMLQLHQEMSRVGRQVDNRAVMDMIQQVDQLSSEISQLTGSIEEQRYEIEGIKKRQRELYADIDRRLRDLESGAAGRAASGSISVPQTSSGTSAAGQAAAAAAAGASSGEAASTTSQTTASPSAASDVERAAYQAAFDTLKEGRYKNAKVELRAFLDKYPNSSYAGNAQYWLGEANYVTRSFEQGIVEFKNVLEKYPTSNKVPDAMLKLGYTYYELKQYPEARQVLTQLRDKFPGETAASLATKRLDRMRKEGH